MLNHRKSLRWTAIIAALLLQAVIGTALAQPDDRVATVSMSGDPSFLDPHREINALSVIISNHFFDALLDRDPVTMEPIPALAESWEILDPETYRFTIRQGVTFHDGVELTVEDVKYSFDRILDPDFSNRVSNYASAIESVEIVDDHTVQLNLNAPYAPMINRMASFYIVPKHYVEEVGNDVFNRKPIGTGPYEFVEWVGDDHLTMVANEAYWRGAPEVKTVIFRPIPEDSTRLAALLTGEIDLADQITADDASIIQRNNCCDLLAADSNGIYYFTINSSNPPFDDVRVRQALSYAINWDEILGLYGDYAVRVTFPSIPTSFGHAELADYLADKTYEYNPERARELLAEAGLADGFNVNLMAPAGRYPNGEEVVQAAASQLEDIGLTTTIEILEWGVFYGELYPAGLQRDLTIGSTNNPLFDPDHYMATNFDPKRTAFYYSNDELTELIDQGVNETDPEARIKVYQLAMEHLLEQAPYIWGFQVQKLYGTSSRLEWAPRVDGRIFMDEASWAD